MALIKCFKCGHLISDKAKVCPKCGAIRMSANQDNPAPTPPLEPEVEDEIKDYTDPPHNNNMLVLLFIVLAVIILGIIIYMCQNNDPHTDSHGTTSLDSVAAVRQDSIAAAEREAARLDSLRKDSMEFRDFTTPDLLYFELHGHVKSVTYSAGSEIGAVSILFGNNRHYSFDKEGNLINKRSLFQLMKPDGENLYGWSYNGNGFPIKGNYAEGGGSPVTTWKYTPDGQLKESYDSYGMHFNEYKYSYDKGHNLIQISYLERGNMGYEVTSTTKVKILETDQWGNWLKRSLSTSTTESHDEFTDDGDARTVKERSSKTAVEQREITYY